MRLVPACTITRVSPLCTAYHCLTGCLTNPYNLPAASLVESAAALNLAQELMSGGAGPRWSLAHVRSLLDRALCALSRCKPWLPTAARQMLKSQAISLESKAAGFAAKHPGAGDSLPAISQAKMNESPMPREAPMRSCAACGKPAMQLMKCGGCRTVAYW